MLMLLPSVPCPADSGAKIRNHGLLGLLAADHEVDAIAFGAPSEDAALGQLARRTTVLPPPHPRSAFRRALDHGRLDLPDVALRLWTPVFDSAVRCFIAQGSYDVVQAEGIEMARYLASVPVERRVYDAHNAEFLLQRRLAGTGSIAARLYSRLQWRRLERFERHVVRNARVTLAVSNHDANQLLALAGSDVRVSVVPNGIDTGRYPFTPPADEVEPNVLFVGKLDFRPNSSAIRWFLDEVLQREHNVRLFAVGAAPPRWLVEAGQLDERIAVTGYVADEAPYFGRCAALVLPLWTGGGSRLKALVAMARGLPIVSTRVGLEGIEAEADRDYLLAESPSEWSAALRRLLDDSRLRKRLASNARALVEQRYDWRVLGHQVRTAYATVGL
jgi:glycosyltransferase involved in cell wall biosynthesis